MRTIFNHFLYCSLTILTVLSCKKLEKTAKLPTVYLIGASKTTNTTIEVLGQFTWDGDSPILSKGLCYGLKENPTISDSTLVIKEDVSDFKSTITGLTKNTNYYIRIFSKNKVGITYSDPISIKTSNADAQLASVITNTVQIVTDTSAHLSGKITNDGGGTILSNGFCISTKINPTINDIKLEIKNQIIDFTGVIVGLTNNTTYYVRSYVINSAGVNYGNNQTFKTNISTKKLPTVSKSEVTVISKNIANFIGIVSDEGSATLLKVGFCYSTNPNPSLFNGTSVETYYNGKNNNFTKQINSFVSGSKYYVRPYATNANGTSYGPEVIFYAKNPTSGYGPNLYDIDGNQYKTIFISNQYWMAENLRVSRFSDGTSIPDLTNDDSNWITSSPAWAYCNRDNNTNSTYGKLYNLYTITIKNYEICPTGWHVPTKNDWSKLSSYLGGDALAGGKMKEKGTSHWISPNTDATNSSFFNALPAGYKHAKGMSMDFNIAAYFWSSASSAVESLEYKSLTYSSSYIFNYNNLPSYSTVGLSIRCLED